VIYLGTLLYSLSVFIYRQSRPHLFMIFICAYGLGLYHYFMHRSAVTSYYVVVIPFIFVALFWIQALLRLLKQSWQKGAKIFLSVWALIALMTGYLFTYYPNSLNLSGFDWAPEKKFYSEQFDFSRDAALIDALTLPQEKVALISSFETKILIQANRRPFFYYFPMMESEHMQGDKWRGLYIHTYARLLRTLNQLKEERPNHIFIQSRLWEGPDAQHFENTHEAFRQLMTYIRLQYQFQSKGQYLTALKLI